MGRVKGLYLAGWQMLQFLGAEFIPNSKKCLLGKDAIFGYLVVGWSGIWLVCPVFGWFVGGLASLCVVWIVCGWFRVLQLTPTVCSNESKFCNRDFW